MVVIVFQYSPEEFVLGVMDGLDDIFIVAGKIEEAATLARRTELGEDVLCGEGK